MTPIELNAHAAQLFYSGAASEAERAWRRALQLAPNYVEAHANLASALLSRTPTTPPARDEAWRALRMAVQLAPASSTFYARLGAMVVAGRPLQALPRPARRVVIRLAHSAARLRPADGALWCNLGLALATHGERRLAQRAYARAATLEPANAEAHMGLAGVQARGAALRTLRRACALVPADARVYHNLGNLLHGPPPGGNLNVRATAAAARCFARAAARRHGQTALLARSSPCGRPPLPSPHVCHGAALGPERRVLAAWLPKRGCSGAPACPNLSVPLRFGYLGAAAVVRRRLLQSRLGAAAGAP